MRKYIYLLVSFFAGLTNTISAISVDQLPLIDQLPSNSVQRIFQDHDGYLWFGTLDGLCRYDSYRMISFRSDLNNPNLLTNNEITAISEDKNANLWIGTKKGLNLMNKKNYQIKPFDSKNIGDQEIKTILVASDSSIWVGTSSSIYHYKSNLILQDYFHNKPLTANSLPNSGINFIYQDLNNDIWVLTWKGGLLKYDSTNKSFFKYPKIGIQDNPFRIFQDKNKKFWICTWGDGLFRFNPNDKGEDMYKHLPTSNKERGENETIFYSIAQDDNLGYIWAMSYSGVYAFKYTDDKKNVQDIDVSNLFAKANNIFSEIVKDRDGNLWIGAFNEGVFTINFNKPIIRNYSIQRDDLESKTHLNIASMSEDNDGLIWFKQNRLGLAFCDEMTGQIKLHKNYPESKSIPNLLTMNATRYIKSLDQMWVGLDDESSILALKKNQGKISLVNRITLPKGEVVQYIYEDSRSNVWVGTSTDLFIKPNNESQLKILAPNIGSVSAISEDETGNIWVGTTGEGIYQLPSYGSQWSPSKMVCYRKSLTLNLNNIETVETDRMGKVWIGTKEGNIIAYDNKSKTFSDYSNLCQMGGEEILNILIDNNGMVWILTNKKITEFDPNNNACTYYTSSDGILVNSFMKNACFKSKSGELFFGGNRGICSFKPSDHLKYISKQAITLITGVNIQGRNTITGNDQAKLNINKNDLNLESNDQNIEIEFSSLNYPFPSKIQYAYKLDGVDDNWIYTGTKRQFAIYNQLKKGKYTFHVKATDENGHWSNRTTTLTIYKKPALYETWWAILIYTLLVILALCLVYRMIRNRMRLKDQLRIAEIDKNKSEELVQTKLRYFTNISHDLLTPLTIISCAIDDIELSSQKTISQHTLIRINIERLKRLLQQILDFRKIESGNMKLNVSSGDIVEFIRNISETSFSPLLNKKGVHFSFDAVPMQIYGVFDADKIDKIVFNLLSNAFKYTDKEGIVDLYLRASTENGIKYLTIIVEDTGRGIAPENLPHIFTRFYANQDTDLSKANGIGLSLAKDLVELHHGTINVTSQLGFGTTFRVQIPIDKKLYEKDALGNPLTIVDNLKIEEQTTNEQLDDAATEIAANKEDTHILIVEDNRELLTLMAKIFAKHYHVYTATNGEEALSIAHNERIEIIVSDVMMPQMDGLELCRNIKNNLKTSHIAIVLLTARNAADDRIECYNAGADGYISKPFDLKVLEARISNLLKNKEHTTNVFKSNVEINISSLECISIDETFLNETVKNIEQNISDIDFDINILAQNMNISKSTLYRKIKSLTGLSPIEFVKNIKLKHACKLLNDKSISIAEVAYLVGFSDPKYFTSCFKSEFKITPREYQRK